MYQPDVVFGKERERLALAFPLPLVADDAAVVAVAVVDVPLLLLGGCSATRTAALAAPTAGSGNCWGSVGDPRGDDGAWEVESDSESAGNINRAGNLFERLGLSIFHGC